MACWQRDPALHIHHRLVISRRGVGAEGTFHSRRSGRVSMARHHFDGSSAVNRAATIFFSGKVTLMWDLAAAATESSSEAAGP